MDTAPLPVPVIVYTFRSPDEISVAAAGWVVGGQEEEEGEGGKEER